MPSPLSPCSVSVSSSSSCLGFDVAPLRMIVRDSSRSSADSASVTNASVSSLPHGVFSPCDSRYHCSKSIVPDFWTSFPSLS